ncbi:uncharacterized protein AKAW2_20137A [Aspergillus luchuensis]|uniref:Major facilitator superfamily (MFS) profile domain-containing protein n=1 Tax=Aspergillus kawachii TaxID=1069201 RepID=A0A7R7W2H8_ASPKA|nr:uncharacterized protein AKAW2_20137A [Aspergillus luchuensis]BCR95197.1 hypothetical protein AKAW2_20137A [Aspergillus luchuensis]
MTELDKHDLEASSPTPISIPNSTKPSPPKDKDTSPNLITWNGPDDPESPQNWPRNLKWKNTWSISLFVFISPISSSMIAPAMNDLAQSLDMIHSEFEIYLSLSIFILGYAIGPVFFGPASEVYGRVRILQVSNLWYLGWNLGCGFARHKGVLFACRFLAGAGGSAPLAVGGQ